MPIPLPTYDTAEAVRLYASGEHSYAELGQRFGVTARTIKARIKREAPDLIGSRGSWAPTFDHAAALELYASGQFNFATLAAHLGVNAKVLRRMIRRKAPHLPTIKLSRPVRVRVRQEKIVKIRVIRDPDLPSFNTDEAISRFATGRYSYGSLAAEMGVARQAIKRLISRRAPHLKRGYARPPADHNAVVTMYASGDYSYPQLARHFSLTEGTIARIVKRKAPHLRKMPPGASCSSGSAATYDRDAMLLDYASGECSQVSLAKKYGVSANTIRLAIGRFAPHLLPGPPAAAFDHDAMLLDHANGVSPRELAEKYSVKRQTIMEVLRRKAPGDRVNRQRLLLLNARPKADFDEALLLYATGGYSLNAVAMLTGLSPKAVRYGIKRYAPDLKCTRGRRRTFDHEVALRMYATGLYTIPALARELGVPVSRIDVLISLKAPQARQQFNAAFKAAQHRITMNQLLTTVGEAA